MHWTFQVQKLEKQYSKHALKNIFTNINKLATKNQGIDYLKRIPYTSPSILASKLYKQESDRTENINLSDFVHITTSSFKIIFDYAPQFISTLKGISESKHTVKVLKNGVFKKETILF